MYSSLLKGCQHVSSGAQNGQAMAPLPLYQIHLGTEFFDRCLGLWHAGSGYSHPPGQSAAKISFTRFSQTLAAVYMSYRMFIVKYML